MSFGSIMGPLDTACSALQVESFVKAAAKVGKGLSRIFSAAKGRSASKAPSTPSGTSSGNFSVDDLLIFSNVRTCWQSMELGKATASKACLFLPPFMPGFYMCRSPSPPPFSSSAVIM